MGDRQNFRIGRIKVWQAAVKMPIKIKKPLSNHGQLLTFCHYKGLVYLNPARLLHNPRFSRFQQAHRLAFRLTLYTLFPALP